MPIEHVNLTEAELHELKGASTALIGSAPVSDGAGSAAWKQGAHSSLYYDDIGTGTTYTTPTAYEVIDPATVEELSPLAFSSNDLGRLTYTGTPTIDASIAATCFVKHSAGSGQDIFFQIHKNGAVVVGAQAVLTADSANYWNMAIACHADAVATSDYFELWLKCASGNVIVHALTLQVTGRLG